MPRKTRTRAVPPKAPKSGRANTTSGEQPQRHPSEDEVIAERRLRAFGLRKSGASYRQIAQQLGVSLNTAWADVAAELGALREATQADAAEVRDIELQRCDAMILGLWPGVRAGNPKAVMAAVRVMERRAKLLGLDAPTKLEHGGAGGGPIAVVAVDVEKLTLEQLEQLELIVGSAAAPEPHA